MAVTFRIVFSGGAEVKVSDPDGNLLEELQTEAAKGAGLLQRQAESGATVWIMPRQVAYAERLEAEPGRKMAFGNLLQS